MSDTFNFQRYWTYFKFYLKQMWRNHAKAAVVIGGSIAILYVIWVLLSLVFTQEWTAPGSGARVATFFVAYTVLVLYQTRTYGYLTDKRAGSSWLMIPASRTEKFVSMLLMTLIVIPVLFVVVFFLLDGLLSVVDPTYGKTFISAFAELWGDTLSGFSSFNSESPLIVPLSALIIMTITGIFSGFLYWLLCGICFKKNKIIGGIAISFGISLALSLILGVIAPALVKSGININTDEAEGLRILAGILNGMEIISVLVLIGLGWGIWRRIKTIQH